MTTQPDLGARIIAAAIARRTAAGLSLKAYGADGYTAAAPYTCHAKSPEQRDAWRASLQSRGFTVEALA